MHAAFVSLLSGGTVGLMLAAQSPGPLYLPAAVLGVAIVAACIGEVRRIEQRHAVGQAHPELRHAA